MTFPLNYYLLYTYFEFIIEFILHNKNNAIKTMTPMNNIDEYVHSLTLPGYAKVFMDVYQMNIIDNDE